MQSGSAAYRRLSTRSAVLPAECHHTARVGVRVTCVRVRHACVRACAYVRVRACVCERACVRVLECVRPIRHACVHCVHPCTRVCVGTGMCGGVSACMLACMGTGMCGCVRALSLIHI